MKTIVTITGIRPDFIRMSEIFKKLDINFNHILIHTGQHYDNLLSGVFFKELNIRQPDYNLKIGGKNKPHYYQTGELSIRIIELLQKEKIDPSIILFLGDSNSVCCATPLKKEGYCIGHIEAGMRSYDKRMLEEINRVVCDHCSDYLFVYHEDYKKQAMKENIKEENIFVVGNTITEVANSFLPKITKKNKTLDYILVDIHRPENFCYKNRLQNIFKYCDFLGSFFDVPLKMLSFGRTLQKIKEFKIDTFDIDFIPLLSYKDFLKSQYNSLCMVSDSGTAQEESCFFNTPVLVPRDYTERPQSITNNCSFMLNVNEFYSQVKKDVSKWVIERNLNNDMSLEWLGEGKTSYRIIDILNSIL